MRIEICGCIAAGKTTLCQTLAQKNLLPVFENFQENPFWKAFYQEPAQFAFETEITFLLQHYHAIKKQALTDNCVFDFSLLQDMAYADINLAGERKKLFAALVDNLIQEICYPKLLIYLTCPPEIALKRIQQRNRDAESSISISYLEDLSAALEQRINAAEQTSPVLRIDSARFDFRQNLPLEIEELLQGKM